MSKSSRSAFRRTKRTALAVGAASLLTFAVTDPGSAAPDAPAAPSQEAFNAGRGQAVAIAYKVNPIFGNLSFGITAGESVAGHQNTAAQGQSKAVNLGVIGVTLGGEGCNGADPTLPEEDQPQPVIVSSDDPGADKGKSANIGEAITMFARATKDPFTEVITKVAPLGDGALFDISAGTATATSGVVAPGVREARAVTHLGSVSILDGAIKIGDLRWEAVQRTGAEETSTGSFTMGSLEILDQAVDLPADALGQLNVLTNALREIGGISITLPQVREDEGVVFVEPLSIGVVPAAVRDDFIGSILAPVLGNDGLGLREILTDAILNLGCNGQVDLLGNNAGTAITVLDLALGTATGAGQTTIELGGVQATTAEIKGFQGLGELPPLPPLPETPPVVPDVGSTSGDLGSAAPTFDEVAAPPVVDEPTAPPQREVIETEPIAAFQGERGGILLGVAAAGLLALLIAAEMDRRKMRRAQRTIAPLTTPQV